MAEVPEGYELVKKREVIAAHMTLIFNDGHHATHSEYDPKGLTINIARHSDQASEKGEAEVSTESN